jgi:hypothetical protein
MERISFCTAVEYSRENRTCIEYLREKIDSYFYLGGRKAHVLKDVQAEAGEIVEYVDQKASCCSTFLKVVSYMTLALPVIMFVMKCIFRGDFIFYLNQKEIVEKKEAGPIVEKTALTVLAPEAKVELKSPALEIQALKITAPIAETKESVREVVLPEFTNPHTLVPLAHHHASPKKHQSKHLEDKRKFQTLTALIHEDKVIEATNNIKNMGVSLSRDGLIKQTIELLAEKGHSEEAAELLDLKFFSNEGSAQALKAFVKGLGCGGSSFEHINRKFLADHFEALGNKKLQAKFKE